MDYKTKSGYTYKGLPQMLTHRSDILRILESAPDYKDYVVVKISRYLWEIWGMLFHIKSNCGDTNEYRFCYKGREGLIYAVTTGDSGESVPYITIVIWVTKNEAKHINNLFFNEILSGDEVHIIGQDLAKFLDPNCGGSVNNPAHLAIASLIMFG